MRERESLFNEYLIEVRKREKEEKNQRREQVRILLRVSLRPEMKFNVIATTDRY